MVVEKICECDACGFEQTADEGVWGMTLSLLPDENGVKYPEYDRVFKMFGKTEHKICWCCWLKSLGVKPLGDSQ
jgi:hypothetical protein